MNRTDYVLGFMFNDMHDVVLIRKTKPAWQNGNLNGIGGKIEKGETSIEAMIREFKEECGVDTSNIVWSKFAEMNGKDFTVHCFKAFDTQAFNMAKTHEEEQIEKHNSGKLSHQLCNSNVEWLVKMATDHNYGREFFATIKYL